MERGEQELCLKHSCFEPPHGLQVTREVTGQLETLLLSCPDLVIPTEMSAQTLPQSPRLGSSLVPKPHEAPGLSRLPDASLQTSLPLIQCRL